MATEPTNQLVRIAELDTTLPIAGGPNKIEPESLILTTGYDDDNAVFAQDLNYTFDNLAQWIAYSQERLNEVDITISNLELKHDQDITALEEQIEMERISVGEIIEITGDSTNPSALKGYGTWESFGEGQVLVGVGSHTDDRSESKTWVDEQEEGEYNHLQTSQELFQHAHSTNTPDHTHNVYGSQTSSPQTDPLESSKIAGEYDGVGAYTNTGSGGNLLVQEASVVVEVLASGGTSPMNNIQPSLAVYRWKRTA